MFVTVKNKFSTLLILRAIVVEGKAFKRADMMMLTSFPSYFGEDDVCVVDHVDQESVIDNMRRDMHSCEDHQHVLKTANMYLREDDVCVVDHANVRQRVHDVLDSFV